MMRVVVYCDQHRGRPPVVAEFYNPGGNLWRRLDGFQARQRRAGKRAGLVRPLACKRCHQKLDPRALDYLLRVVVAEGVSVISVSELNARVARTR